MSTMKNFHKQLNNEAKDSYMDILARLTSVDRSQLSALASELEWQTWGEQPVEPAKA